MSGIQIADIILSLCGVVATGFGFTGPAPDPKQWSMKRALRMMGPILIALGLVRLFYLDALP
jgi:hypothetical protein